MDTNRAASCSPTFAHSPRVDECSRKENEERSRPDSDKYAANTEASPEDRAGDSPSYASLSRTRAFLQMPLPEEAGSDEAVVSECPDNIEEFLASHTFALHKKLDSLKEAIEDLSTSLTANQERKEALEKAILQRQESARTRIMSRENTIKDLQADNNNLIAYIHQSDNLLSNMQTAMNAMQQQLASLDAELDQKLGTLSSQSNTGKEIQNAHQEALENRDRKIVALGQQIEIMKTE